MQKESGYLLMTIATFSGCVMISAREELQVG
jgi:hypothetical protein